MSRKIALLFAGQGAQVVGMGKDLAEQVPEAKKWFQEANEILGYDLAGLCFHGPEEELTKTENAQPGIYLISWIAFQLLKERLPTLRFEAAAGLSLGEFTALAAAGAFSFQDGLKLVRERGRFMQEACEVTRGSMAAVIGLEETVVREVCNEAEVQVANLNCPGQIVISGESEKIGRACELAKGKGAKRVVLLPVSGGYHSGLMSSAQPKLKSALEGIRIHEPEVPVISNVTASPHGTMAEMKEKLVEQVTASILWEQSMRHLLGEGFNCFIELGPGTALTGFMKRIDKTVQSMNISNVASLKATTQAVIAAPEEPNNPGGE